MIKHHSTTHGLSGTRIYRIYKNMRQRCYNPNNTSWNNYGGRGIKICDEWLMYDYKERENIGLVNFYNWAINNGYNDTLTIDRINPDGNYCPENCRWVDQKFQSNNRSDNHFIQYMGYNFTVAIWSEITKIPVEIIRHRISKSWTSEQILRTPPNSSRWGDNYLAWTVPIEYVKYHNPDTDRKQTNVKRGPLSEETKHKMSKMRKGIPKYNCRKLTDEQVQKIKEMKAQGYRTRELGRLFNVSHSTVSDILNGKLYKSS